MAVLGQQPTGEESSHRPRKCNHFHRANPHNRQIPGKTAFQRPARKQREPPKPMGRKPTDALVTPPGRRPTRSVGQAVLKPQAGRTKRDGFCGREAASAKPRCLRHRKTRPACASNNARRRSRHPAAPRPQTDAQRRTGRPQTASGPHETGRVLRPRSGLGEAEVPPAPQDPSRLRIQQRETSFTAPRCPPAADRRAASDRPPQALKRGVSPGLVSRRS